MATTILIPVDESEWSERATDLGLWIATRADGAVRLVGLHVVNVTQIRGRLLEDVAGMLGFEPVVVPDQVERHFVDQGRLRLDRFEESCRAAGVPCTTVLDQGGVVDRIIHHADHQDLVIMGVRGETEERFPGQGGGTAERVLRRVSASTIVVPREQRAINGVVIGYDGSAGSARALQATARLLDLVKVPVHAVCVADRGAGPKADLDEVRRRLEGAGVEVTTERLPGEPQEVLPAEAVRLGYDLLALGYRGRSRLKDIFLGRTTEWLVGHVAMGMLIAR